MEFVQRHLAVSSGDEGKSEREERPNVTGNRGRVEVGEARTGNGGSAVRGSGAAECSSQKCGTEAAKMERSRKESRSPSHSVQQKHSFRFTLPNSPRGFSMDGGSACAEWAHGRTAKAPILDFLRSFVTV
ncbi:hypothetical protein GPALN_006149 [Globodera pallida]|nr:hypothetical protein GPALN_006149 [Globodera pallida]